MDYKNKKYFSIFFYFIRKVLNYSSVTPEKSSETIYCITFQVLHFMCNEV